MKTTSVDIFGISRFPQTSASPGCMLTCENTKPKDVVVFNGAWYWQLGFSNDSVGSPLSPILDIVRLLSSLLIIWILNDISLLFAFECPQLLGMHERKKLFMCVFFVLICGSLHMVHINLILSICVAENIIHHVAIFTL